jgi:hypothetical protein
MANPFETVILKLKDLGFFQFFLPFIFSAAVFYGLLRKSQIFGDAKQNITINAIVSMVAAFMVWAYPIIAGINIETQMATFWTLSMIAALPIIVTLLFVGFILPPDLPKGLAERLKGRPFYALIIVFVLIGFGILVASGLFAIFLPSGIGGEGFGGFSLSDDTILTIVIVIIMVASAVAIVFASGREEKPKASP